MVALTLSACHAQRPLAVPPPSKAAPSLVVQEITDDAMGATVVEILRSTEPGGKRSSLLAGVVRNQLRRAESLMSAGQLDAGLRAVRGAIWLVRAGEERSEMWQGAAVPLSEAAEEAARVGDEGKTRALYSLVKQAGPTAAMAAAVDEHIAAMDRFAQSNASQADLGKAGDAQRVAVQRAIYEPSVANLETAARSLSNWMRKSLQSDVLERWGDASFDREEAIEAFRARRFGALTMVGLFLRHASPMNALDWLEQNDLGRLLPAEVRDRLEQAGEDDDTRAWQILYQHFQNEAEPSRADSSVGVELAEAAAFGTAIELYRSGPDQLAYAGPLALMLPDVMLGDVVPALIKATTRPDMSREDASWSMALISRAMLAHGAVGDITGARRLFSQSKTIFDRAIQLAKSGPSLRPHPAKLFAVMATLESRHAELERASVAFKQSLALEPAAGVYVELARTETQLGRFADARRSIQGAMVVARKANDLLTETEAQILLYELESDQGDVTASNRTLRDALNTVLSARDRARLPEEQALAERRLARILELYGEQEGSKRASMRALDAARMSNQQRTATIMDAGRRALTYGDLRAAREALRDAFDFGIPSADCVYVALWVRIIERQQKIPSDGSVEKALARTGDVALWPGRLKAWMTGSITDQELEQAAHTEAERAEFKFYRALTAPGEEGTEASRKAIAEVARSHAIGLVEVSVAKDLVRLRDPRNKPIWPEDIRIP